MVVKLRQKRKREMGVNLLFHCQVDLSRADGTRQYRSSEAELKSSLTKLTVPTALAYERKLTAMESQRRSLGVFCNNGFQELGWTKVQPYKINRA